MTCHLPDDLIVLISGVPGAGKTTISYELLKIHTEIRLIEETDIIRDILRGYNIYLKETCNFEFDKVCSHDIFLTYDMAKEQCKIKHGYRRCIFYHMIFQSSSKSSRILLASKCSNRI